ncbi:CBL-interacting protein kinase 2-like [Salvia miltiorrhiza]|uniref:CBL-interacting protein kinase 2-like n=1 Tax=Salvia miltiorrhiza TaxID=226208 RepID=UPI0025AB775D|nr:CBL-interacting protein kinase 2-like [Salvia miltiorrhiza]XP_057808286.1 CBL-interacting protein kinase 2-like [Salvia miltiorrhiza]
MDSKGGILMERYEFGKLLGQGTFAKVYHARDVKNGASVAIKVIDKEKIVKVGMMEQIKREISVMKLVRHPNVVQLYEVMATKAKIYFIMEYVRGGELFNKVTKGKMKEDAARKFFQQLISAVDFCHSRGVYHRDLKPENLLLDEHGNLKISDFGLSALAESRQQDGLLHTTCGTPAYVAPEVISRRGYDGAKADIWSCGVILFVLLSGQLPFHDSNLMEMYRKIGKAEFKYPNWIPPDARRLISKILDPNPSTRISISKIMENSWFRRGLKSKAPAPGSAAATTNNEKEEAILDIDAKAELAKPVNLNAFEIISLSAGFDLSGLFEGSDQKKEIKFTSAKNAKTIISKLEEVATRLKMKVSKKNGGHMKFDGTREGRKGLLSIDAEIFEVAPDFHLVEMKKANGDTLEYQKVVKKEIRPSLKDIVWTWQGEEPPPPPPQQPDKTEFQTSQVSELLP